MGRRLATALVLAAHPLLGCAAVSVCGGCTPARGTPVALRATSTETTALVEHAAAVWGESGAPVYVALEGGIPVVMASPEAVARACKRPGTPTEGCATKCRSHDGAVLYVATGLDPARARMVIVHETGHYLARTGAHLEGCDAPGDDVMCPTAARAGTAPTDRDLAWVGVGVDHAGAP